MLLKNSLGILHFHNLNLYKRTTMKRILIVDDDPAITNMLAREIRPYGYEPVGAMHGRQAQELLGRNGNTIECVISDINMPILGGWELLEHLRRVQNDMPVILMAIHDWYRLISMKQGAYLFWLKSDQVRKLLRGIVGVIEKNELLKKRRAHPRRNLIGKLTFCDRRTIVEATVYNVSEKGVMFEVDQEVVVENEFAASLIFSEIRIEIERLEVVWRSFNSNRDLFGAKIAAMPPADGRHLKKICALKKFTS